MKSQTLQITLEPVSPEKEFTSFYMDLNITGHHFRAIVSKTEADRMVEIGFVPEGAPMPPRASEKFLLQPITNP